MAKKKTPQKDVIKEAANTLVNAIDELKGTQAPEKIAFDVEPAPQLDPNSPEYDPKAAKVAKEIADERLKEIKSHLLDVIANIVFPARTALLGEGFEEILARAKAVIDRYNRAKYEYIQAELKKPEYGGRSLAEIETDGQDENGEIIPGSVYEKLMAAVDLEMDRARLELAETQLQPYLQEELQKSKYDGRTIEDLREEYLHSKADNTLYEQAYNAANEAVEAADHAEPENLQATRPKNQIIPTDKFTGVMFADWLDMEREQHGQLSMFPVKMEPDDYPKDLTLYFDIRYPEELPEKEKKMTPMDRRIYQSMYNLQQINGDMTYSQIFRNAGLGETPNSRQIELVRKSIDKMRRTTTTWDNREEATAYNASGTYIQYDGYLCPAEIITERKCFNGKPVEMYVRTLRPLPLMEFAKERRQVALVPNYVIALPPKVSATDQNIALIDYTAKRIVRAKNEDKDKPANKRKGYVKILYDTLYKGIGANTRQKQRTALKNLYVYLDELRDKGFIKSYKEEKTKSTGAVGVAIIY